jgi:hypothetical protein
VLDFPYKGAKMKNVVIAFLAVMTVVATAGTSSAGGVSLGGGIHYLHNVSDIDDNGVDLDKNNLGFVGSIMGRAGFLNLEGQVEYIHSYLGTEEGLWLPQAWALLGSAVYAGAGIGIGHFHDEWMSDPFYALRAGVNLPLGPVGLDMYGTYQFWNSDAFDEVNHDDLDAITFAALLRFNLGGD